MKKYELTVKANNKVVLNKVYTHYWQAATAAIRLQNLGYEVLVVEI